MKKLAIQWVWVMFRNECIDVPYDHTLAAIRAAYRAEVMEVMKTSSPGVSSGRDPWEVLAEGSMTLAFIHRVLHKHDRAIIDCLYTIPMGRLKERKEYLCRQVGARLHEDWDGSVSQHWITDVVRKWAGIDPHHDHHWWSNYLGKTERTLRYWTNGRPTRHQTGVVPELESWHGLAFTRLQNMMLLEGVIARESRL